MRLESLSAKMWLNCSSKRQLLSELKCRGRVGMEVEQELAFKLRARIGALLGSVEQLSLG